MIKTKSKSTSTNTNTNTNTNTSKSKKDKKDEPRYEKLETRTSLINKIFKLIYDGMKLWVYEARQGIWRNDADNFIKEKKMDMFDTSSTKKEIISRLKDANYKRNPSFDENEGLIPLVDGVIKFDRSLDSMKFEKHSSENMLTSTLPLFYDKDAESEYLIPFIKKTVTDENELWNLYAMIGYGLLRYNPIKAIFWILGKPDTGKSTLVEVLERFYSRELCSFVNVYDFDEEYYLAELDRKMINIHDDIPPTSLGDKAISNLKWLSGGNSAKLARKPYGLPKNITVRPKGVFIANEYPGAKTPDEAYNKRCIFIYFNHIFPYENRNEKIDLMTTKKELSALLNIAIDHLKELLERKCFKTSNTIPKSNNSVREVSKDRSDEVVSLFKKKDEVVKDRQRVREERRRQKEVKK